LNLEDKFDCNIKSVTLNVNQINLNELLIAQGDISVNGDFIEVAELATSKAGPRLSDVQRDWISQLASRPLRLYDVTDVVPGRALQAAMLSRLFCHP
jgi:hypothetical protein